MASPEPTFAPSAPRASAWELFLAAPVQYSVAGLLLFLISSSVPIIGTILSGPLWVGLCAMALRSMRGEIPKVEDFFAPFGDNRLQASLVLGGIITAVQMIGSFLGVALMMGSFFHLTSTMYAQQADMLAGPLALTLSISFFLILLPFVIMAYFLLPAAYFIAHGETDGMQAVRRTWRMVTARSGYWSAFWGKMALGHLLGLCCCCVGIFPALAWNAIAMMQAAEKVEPPYIPDGP